MLHCCLSPWNQLPPTQAQTDEEMEDLWIYYPNNANMSVPIPDYSLSVTVTARVPGSARVGFWAWQGNGHLILCYLLGCRGKLLYGIYHTFFPLVHPIMREVILPLRLWSRSLLTHSLW